MPKAIAELSWKRVQALDDGTHHVGGVKGLCIQKRGDAQSWILAYRFAGRAREMGLGSIHDLTLAKARDAARDARELLLAGVDPIESKHQKRDEAIAATRRQLTFGEAAKQCIAAKSPEWRNSKHKLQWSSTLATYAEPTIGALPVDKIETPHVLRCLEPIWTTKTETATRVRQRIETVLDWCTARGYRNGDNPARWNGHLENLLAKPRKVTKVEHFAAVAWQHMPAFMERLRDSAGMGARALEFVVLTAARSGEVRGAVWGEIDLDAATWTVPAGRMKAGVEHTVPLSAPALRLLRELPRFKGVKHVFPSARRGPLSDMALTAVLRRMKIDATAHGMRSSFRDWASESTNYPREVAEKALAHTISSAVEAAYRRGDLIAKRTRMMRDWGAYVSTPRAPATVTAIRAKRAAR
jgi:integrase